MGRQEGFYWALVADRWMILEWVFGGWFMAGVEDGVSDIVLEIDERRIERQP